MTNDQQSPVIPTAGIRIVPNDVCLSKRKSNLNSDPRGRVPTRTQGHKGKHIGHGACSVFSHHIHSLYSQWAMDGWGVSSVKPIQK